MAFDTKGRLWFPAPNMNALEMYNTNNHTFHKWRVPTANALPWDVVVDHHGKVWFTEHYSNKIGRFDPATHTFMEIATPASNSMPYGITVDANNNIWFTENNSSVALIGEYTSAGQLLEYKIRNTTYSGLTPHLIVVDHTGNIWWSEGFAASIAELKVAQAVPGTYQGVSEYFYPLVCSTCGAHTSGISVDSNNNIWFDDSLQSIFGSFPASGTGNFSIYNTPTSNSHPHDGLNVDRQNRIWFDEEFANKLAQAIQ
jgi:virginiamycin B lyase